MIFKKTTPITNSRVIQVLSSMKLPDSDVDLIGSGMVKRLQVKDGNASIYIELKAKYEGYAKELRAEIEKKIRASGKVEDLTLVVTAKPAPSSPSQQAPNPSQTAPKPKAIEGVRHVIAVASGKGGVGKSTIALNLAVELHHMGNKVGILDADIYGPSIPTMMGIEQIPRPEADETSITPVEFMGLKVISMGFFTNPDQPIVWRGPMVHSALTQFLYQVKWGPLDYLIIDMPPGTGDAQLSIGQNAPLSGAVIVSTPQRVSLIDADKGLRMFKKIQVPILGIVENMSGHVCAKCNHVTPIFKIGGAESLAITAEAPFLGKIPIDARIAHFGDEGKVISQECPDSDVARAIHQAAVRLTGQLKEQKTFKPQTLQWQ